jgi:Fe-S-cluster containining protein
VIKPLNWKQEDPGSETRLRGESALHRRVLSRPKKYFFILKNAQKEFFGRSQSLICPFYDREKGRCTIRPFWDAICNTWFCKYSAGEDGRQFWMALKNYLIFIEKTLMHYTLYKMGWGPQQTILLESLNVPLTLQEVDDQPPDQKSYRELWKDWAGREENFYKKTYQIVIDITPKAFEKITGIYQKILLEEVDTRQKNLFNPQLPKVLKRNPKLQVEKKGENSYFLIGYSSFDPFEVSKRAYDLLDFFDGRKPNDEVCRLIKNRTGARLDKDFLTSLYQFRILVANEKD